jgi:hypothetical protein
MSLSNEVLAWVAHEEAMRARDVTQSFSPMEIMSWPTPPEWYRREREYQYRKGFYHGIAEAANLVGRLYRRGGYVRPQEIANILGEWTDELRRWKSRAIREESPLQTHSHPSLKWRKWSEIKREVHERDGNCCTECGSTEGLEAHHIEPVAEGGTPRPQNLTTLCKRCHRGVCIGDTL